MTGQPTMHIMVFLMHFLALCRQRQTLSPPSAPITRTMGTRGQYHHLRAQRQQTSPASGRTPARTARSPTRSRRSSGTLRPQLLLHKPRPFQQPLRRCGMRRGTPRANHKPALGADATCLLLGVSLPGAPVPQLKYFPYRSIAQDANAITQHLAAFGHTVAVALH